MLVHAFDAQFAEDGLWRCLRGFQGVGDEGAAAGFVAQDAQGADVACGGVEGGEDAGCDGREVVGGVEFVVGQGCAAIWAVCSRRARMVSGQAGLSVTCSSFQSLLALQGLLVWAALGLQEVITAQPGPDLDRDPIRIPKPGRSCP